MKWFDKGKINPHVDKVFPAEQVADAHHYIQDRQNIGKVLLDFDELSHIPSKLGQTQLWKLPSTIPSKARRLIFRPYGFATLHSG